jgi:hypothetical protein
MAEADEARLTRMAMTVTNAKKTATRSQNMAGLAPRMCSTFIAA